MQKKQFVLDTNVLLHDSDCLTAFQEHDVVIILPVLEELDTFKKAPGELGHNARQVIRTLDKLRELGSLSSGVTLPSGGTLRIIEDASIFNGTIQKVDNQILAASQKLLKKNKNTVIVTKDVHLRVKADTLKIPIDDYHNDKIDDISYAGYSKHIVDAATVAEFHNNKQVQLPEELNLHINEYVSLVNDTNVKNTGVGKHVGHGKILKLNNKISAAGILSKNLHQCFAIDALLDPNIKLVTIQGCAGTGKTLITMAAAIQQAYIDKTYDTILISKPITPVGGKANELGFLPGDVNEKLSPYYQSFMDSIKFIKMLDMKSTKKADKSFIGTDFDSIMEFLPLTFLRGRSLVNSIVILDECQNCTPNEIKTLITRAGENCKIVLLSDLEQIDNTFVDRYSNGFVSVTDKFKGQKMYAHVQLTHCERSELSEIAAKLL
jgi:PhoH-like ATPase